jgi:hypothetical protein
MFAGRPILLILLVALLSPIPAWGRKAASEEPELTCSYDEMEPAQARLIDDWFDGFNKVMGENRGTQSRRVEDHRLSH